MNICTLLFLSAGTVLALDNATLAGRAAPRVSVQAPATVSDAVYNEEQAARGKATYDTKCASCHDGGTMGPELWGDPFLASWDSKTLGEFFTRIKTTMPEDAPGSLSEKEILDVIAYVIKTNGFPAGDKSLPSESGLAAIKFVRK